MEQGKKTAKEMSVALGYQTTNLSRRDISETFLKYFSELSDAKGYVFNLFNAVILDKKFNLDPSYKADLQKKYQATIEHVNFRNESKRATEKINKLVAEKTHGNIDKLLEDLDPSTVLVLLNAVYFKGSWKWQFNPKNTKEEVFFQNGLEKETKKVPMMKLSNVRIPYAEVDHFQVFELPYKGEDLSMMVFLPEKMDGLKGLTAAVKGLTTEKLVHMRQKLSKTVVEITMPKFKLNYEKEMSNVLKKLGMKSLFHQGADLSGLSKDDGVFVTEVQHQAFVEVNEEGTETAAATGIFGARSAIRGSDIVLNRPFLFSIVDKRNLMILFTGCVKQL